MTDDLDTAYGSFNVVTSSFSSCLRVTLTQLRCAVFSDTNVQLRLRLVLNVYFMVTSGV